MIPADPLEENKPGHPEPEQLQRVQVVNRRHPHYEEYGRFTGKMISLLGTPMAEVKLEQCRHGTDGCFVKKGDVRAVSERP